MDQNKFSVNAILSLAPTIINKLKGMALIPIISRTLGSQGFGIWIQFTTTATLICIISGLNMGYTMNKFLSNKNKKSSISEFFAASIIIIISTAIISIVTYYNRHYISQLIFGTEAYTNLIILIGIVVFAKVYFRQSLQFLRSQSDFRGYSFWSSIHSVAVIILVGIVLFFNSSISTLFIYYVLNEFVIVILITVYIIYDWGLSYPNFSPIYEYLSYGVPLIFSSLSHWIANTSDRYILVYFINASAVGSYSILYGLSSIILVYSSGIENVLFPNLSKYISQDKDIRIINEELAYSIEVFLLFAIPSSAGLYFISELAISIIVNEQIPRIKISILFLSIAMVFFGLFRFYSSVLNAYSKTKTTTKIYIFIGVINIFVNIILIPKFGILGAVFSTLISFIIGFGISVYTSPVTITPRKKILLYILVATGIMVVNIMAMREFFIIQSTYLKFAITIFMGLITYCIAIIPFIREVYDGPYDGPKQSLDGGEFNRQN